MAVIDKKPDICELVGIAVNTSVLALKEDRETPLERIAALGAAAAEVASGADLQGLPLAAMGLEVYRRSASMADLMLDPGTPQERDVIAAELGQDLMHIRFGDQHALVPKAIRLFARWLRSRRAFADFTAEQQPLLERFAACVLHEWMSDRCIACGGTGKLERVKGGAWIRPRGSMQRNATFGACNACHGSGRAMPSHTNRVRWLGITLEVYDSERWQQRFNAAFTWLQHLIVGRLKRPLTNQLERRTKRN